MSVKRIEVSNAAYEYGDYYFGLQEEEGGMVTYFYADYVETDRNYFSAYKRVKPEGYTLLLSGPYCKLWAAFHVDGKAVAIDHMEFLEPEK